MCEKNIKVQLNNGGISFSAAGLSVNGMRPSLAIKVGKEERHTILELNNGAFSHAAETQKKIDTYAGAARETTLFWSFQNGYEFVYSIALLERVNGFILKGSFHNGSSEAVRLSEIVLAETPSNGVLCTGNASDWWLSTLVHDNGPIGNLSEKLPSKNEMLVRMLKNWNLPVPRLPRDEKLNNGMWRIYRDFLTLYTDSGSKGMSIGPVGKPEADIRYDCFVDSGSMGLKITSEMSDVLVEPGQWKSSQEVLIIAESYDFAVRNILNWIAVTHGHRTHRGPLTGWCSWYDLAKNITEDSIICAINAFASLKEQVKVKVIQIDDGYQKEYGNWEANEKFPGGLKKLADMIKEAGAVPGIWLAPLIAHESTGLPEAHPEWFQHDAEGKLLEIENWDPKWKYLDPTHNGAREFLRKVIRDKKEQGFMYFKIDFNGLDNRCRFHDPYKTRLQVFRDLYRLYREEAGEDAYILSCTGFITRGTVGYVDASRIGPDAGAEWSAPHPCTFLECIRAVGMSALANGIFYANDPDCTYLKPPAGSKLTMDEIKTWHSFVGLLGGLALTSDHVGKQGYADCVRMLEILNPPAAEKAVPLCPGSDGNHSQFGYIYHRPWGISASVMLWNPDDKPARAKINMNALGALQKDFHVWSFWDEKYLGTGEEAIENRIIPPHGNIALKLTAVDSKGDQALLIGSNLHISSGAAEVEDFAANNGTVKISLNSAGAGSGNLCLYCRKPLQIKASKGCFAQIKEYRTGNIWRVEVSGRKRESLQIIELTL